MTFDSLIYNLFNDIFSTFDYFWTSLFFHQNFTKIHAATMKRLLNQYERAQMKQTAVRFKKENITPEKRLFSDL